MRAVLTGLVLERAAENKWTQRTQGRVDARFPPQTKQNKISELQYHFLLIRNQIESTQHPTSPSANRTMTASA
jgi:hypothetical protein